MCTFGRARTGGERRSKRSARLVPCEKDVGRGFAINQHWGYDLQLVADAHTVQRDLAALPEHTFAEAQKVLSVEQQARFLLFRRDLQGEVRQAIRKRATPTPPATVAAPGRHAH